MGKITIHTLSGNHITKYLPELARLRIEVFREFPYLYDGNMTYEMSYLETYSKSDQTVVVLALSNDEVVGASTGLPMEMETDEVKAPFIKNGYDPAEVFYFGESVLRTQYRGKGIGVKFFKEREAHVQKLHRFKYITFCAVQRPINHPLRPVDYQPLNAFWEKRGYTQHPELKTLFKWKDLNEDQETFKEMRFWMSNG